MSSRKLLATTLQAVLAFVALAPFVLSQTRPKDPKSVRLYVFDNGVIKGLIGLGSISKGRNRSNSNVGIVIILFDRATIASSLKRYAISSHRPVIHLERFRFQKGLPTTAAMALLYALAGLAMLSLLE